MKNRYNRNRLYITKEEQKLIKKTSILLAGAGIGSIIAECLLRLGFETLTIIDGDVVELSNLNRQNYIENNISNPKVEAIKERLLAINNKAKITIHNCFLTPENVNQYIKGHKIAINALDFTSEVPLLFDSLCQKKNIPVLHPYN
jgi:tRNA A37 threonylcarbamoyladenosine dehydratase